jgi:diguanylate cyclase (GGDEF)-like protein
MAQRVLVVDDEPTIRFVLSQVLTEAGFDVVEATSGEEALETFKRSTFPVVVTDIIMGRMSGIDLLANLRELDPEVQVVVMTSQGTLDTATSALRNGAYDYLQKPFEDLDAITTVIERAIEKKQLADQNAELMRKLQKNAQQLEETNQQLEDLAMKDGLTGLFNRRSLHDKLTAELSRCRRHGHPLSLLFVDVDHFKLYNDTHGHQAGDDVLTTFARLLQKNQRSETVVARYGGEEFVVLLPEVPKVGAAVLADDLRRRVEDHPFEGRETQPGGRVTMSVGVATFPDDAEDEDALVAAADRALYRAKSSGRNAVR